MYSFLGVCDDGPMFRASVHEYPTCDDKSIEHETFKGQFQSSSDCGNGSFVISGFEEDSFSNGTASK
ncbi:hypothetical protein M0R45_014329 [Rubus argutus]|uniref:Uncharacterized protein n=1 Tax=Rubus argutus TaxID=59490 RepID=A0AAW1XLX5_RUBAR